MKKYKQKDLGYPRENTDAELHINMSDGSIWSIPVQIIVDARDEYYQDEKEDTVKFVRDRSLTNYEIIDFASNNMNFSDFNGHAKEIPTKRKKLDFEEEWANGDKEVVGEI